MEKGKYINFMNNQEQIDQLQNNIQKAEPYLSAVFASMYVLVGIVVGVVIMYATHKDIYSHYNTCQEGVLKEAVARLSDENCYKLFTDSITGKITIK